MAIRNDWASRTRMLVLLPYCIYINLERNLERMVCKRKKGGVKEMIVILLLQFIIFFFFAQLSDEK